MYMYIGKSRRGGGDSVRENVKNIRLCIKKEKVLHKCLFDFSTYYVFNLKFLFHPHLRSPFAPHLQSSAPAIVYHIENMRDIKEITPLGIYQA